MKFWLVLCSAVFIAMPLWAGAPIAEIQSMLAKPKVLCGHFEQSKQLIGLKKPMVIDYSDQPRWIGKIELSNLRYHYRLTIESVSASP